MKENRIVLNIIKYMTCLCWSMYTIIWFRISLFRTSTLQVIATQIEIEMQLKSEGPFVNIFCILNLIPARWIPAFGF